MISEATRNVDPLRTLARPGIAGAGIALLVAFVALMVAVNQWRYAEILLGFAALWPALWLWYQPLMAQAIEFGLLLFSAAVFFVAWFYIEAYRTDQILSLNNGLLLPADDAYPLNVCAGITGPKDKLLLMGTVSALSDIFPITVISVNETPIVRLNLIKGMLAVSAKFVGQDGKVLAELIDNNWRVNPNAIYYKRNDDVSSLSVFDQYDTKVLDVRFADPSFIKMTGILRYNKSVIEMSDERGLIVNGRSQMRESCIAHVRAGFIEISD